MGQGRADAERAPAFQGVRLPARSNALRFGCVPQRQDKDLPGDAQVGWKNQVKRLFSLGVSVTARLTTNDTSSSHARSLACSLFLSRSMMRAWPLCNPGRASHKIAEAGMMVITLAEGLGGQCEVWLRSILATYNFGDGF